MAYVTIILLQVLSRAFQAIESFVYEKKNPKQTLYFQNMQKFVNRH